MAQYIHNIILYFVHLISKKITFVLLHITPEP